MKIDGALPHRWRTSPESARHAQAVAAILDTPPITPNAGRPNAGGPNTGGTVLFTAVGTANLLPYLVAVKSLWHQLRRGRVAILDDGTLTPQDRAILAHHCGDPELIAMGSAEPGPFPSGGGWEHFLTVLDRRNSEYWITLASDTVTIGPVDEVLAAISRNRSFTLLSRSGPETSPLPLSEFTRMKYSGGPDDSHAQTSIESRLGQLPPGQGWRYVQGSAGLAGYAAMGPGRQLAASFLEQLEQLVGTQNTLIQGAEQVAANFQLANEPDLAMLPHDKYLNHPAEGLGEEASFLHFAGIPSRANDAYIHASQQAIDAMLRGN